MNSRSNNKLGDRESHLEETKTLQRKENVKKKKVVKSELREDTACMKQGQDTVKIKNRNQQRGALVKKK